ncbi:1-aminocyclopropane-1-carboxylate deaminase/D-cysteine desulfhydrase [Marinicella sp. W31]|uniref:1-aminocyclopropane-1-carboxylate deaminase/D-cysteine desulfhydrase n=1 Tax=Marinicella sp. W31 TaxID=3023713 RepID=UPI003757CE1E
MMQNTGLSPIEYITIQGVQVAIKRDDLNDPLIQGNKLRKLKYNVQHAIKQQHTHIVTFGGAFSNHIAATAAAGHRWGIKTVGIIRGAELAENKTQWSDTLKQAQQQGMHLIFVSREAYRLKHNSAVFKSLLKTFDAPYVIPEGGSNALGVTGVAEIMTELQQQLPSLPTHIICACGTGGTLAGLMHAVAETQLPIHIWGIVVHTAATAIAPDIKTLCKQHQSISWQLFDQYHFGGYAKTNNQLEEFACQFRQQHRVALDRVYNCKSFYALYDLIDRGALSNNDRPLIIHTGGTQGGVF